MSDFDNWYKPITASYAGRPFPAHAGEVKEYCREAYEAGRKAGVDEGRTVGLEEAAEYIEIQSSDIFMDADFHATAIRERITNKQTV